MSSEQPTPEQLTADERFFIARKLLARAEDKAKGLQQAIANKTHPQLIAQLRAEIAECTRLALKLQDIVT